MRVQLVDPDPGLHAHERLTRPTWAQQLLLQFERLGESRGEDQESPRERHVGPGMARPDGAHRAVGPLGLLDQLDYLFERRRPDDSERVDALIARVVAPLSAKAEG